MTMILNRHHQICKFLFVLALLFVIAFVYAGGECVYALTDETSLSFDYSKFNYKQTKDIADKYFRQALYAKSKEERTDYLEKACAKYYILSNINKKDIYPCIMLARVYGLQKKDSYAKAYFYRALGLDSKDSEANYYFGEFFYERNKYDRALEYYNKALMYGRKADAQTYQKISRIYQRYGDMTRAKFYNGESQRLKNTSAKTSK